MRIIALALLLSACTTAQLETAGKAADLSIDGCRAYLRAFPNATGRVGDICRKVLDIDRVVAGFPTTAR